MCLYVVLDCLACCVHRMIQHPSPHVGAAAETTLAAATAANARSAAPFSATIKVHFHIMMRGALLHWLGGLTTNRSSALRSQPHPCFMRVPIDAASVDLSSPAYRSLRQQVFQQRLHLARQDEQAGDASQAMHEVVPARELRSMMFQPSDFRESVACRLRSWTRISSRFLE